MFQSQINRGNKNMAVFENVNTTKLINQIKSSQDQYPILSKNEERELIAQYRDNRDV